MTSVAEHDDKNKPEIIIPEAFKPFEHKKVWLCSDPTGKPVSPVTKSSLKFTSPENWGDFEEVKAYLAKYHDHSPAIVTSPLSGLTCLDLDDSIETDGKLKPWASDIVEKLDSYTEISSSGRGLHIFTYGNKEDKGVKTTYEECSVEIYGPKDSPKPIRITGHIYEGKEVIKPSQKGLDWFCRTYFKPREKLTHPWTTSPSMTDEEILDKLRKAKNKDKFSQLFDKGDKSRNGGDTSAADMALVNMFAFYTQDPKQIDRLFKLSKLMREKWNRQDYREGTIDKALGNLRSTYQGVLFFTERIDIKEAERVAQRILEEDDPCKGFTLEYLPPRLEDYISIKCETTEANPILLTQSVLTMTSSFLKKKCYIPKGEYFQDLYSNIWVLEIDESGNFKTTALNSGHAACDIQEEKISQLYSDLEKLGAVKTNEQDKNEIARIQKELSEKSVCLPNRITAEALIKHLSQGHGGVIRCSEFGAWLSSLESKYNGDLKAIFTDFYDVPSTYVYLNKTEGRQHVEKPFITICGMAALPWITSNLSIKDVESGFFARFLIFWPHEDTKIPKARPDGKINAAERALDTSIHKRLSDIQFDEGGRIIFGEESKELFDSTHENLYHLMSGLGEDQERMLRPFVKRWSPTLLKLAMLIRVYDDNALKTNTIEPSHLLGAISILQPAVKSTIKLLSREFGETPQQKKMRVVKDYIARHGGKVKRETLLVSKALGGGYTEYDYYLETMEERGELTVLREDRAKLEWEYVLRESKK